MWQLDLGLAIDTLAWDMLVSWALFLEANEPVFLPVHGSISWPDTGSDQALVGEGHTCDGWSSRFFPNWRELVLEVTFSLFLAWGLNHSLSLDPTIWLIMQSSLIFGKFLRIFWNKSRIRSHTITWGAKLAVFLPRELVLEKIIHCSWSRSFLLLLSFLLDLVTSLLSYIHKLEGLPISVTKD